MQSLAEAKQRWELARRDMEARYGELVDATSDLHSARGEVAKALAMNRAMRAQRDYDESRVKALEARRAMGEIADGIARSA